MVGVAVRATGVLTIIVERPAAQHTAACVGWPRCDCAAGP
jgi:hypothetical protein